MPELKTARSRSLPVAEAEARRKDRGLIGHLFGTADHAPLNIAGLVILICIVGVILAYFFEGTKTVAPLEMMKLLSGIALACLAFLGGYLSGKGSRSE